MRRLATGYGVTEGGSVFETLRNFAEIGIAIAGFSAIASALSSRISGSWSERDRLALLSLLETSALVVFFALVPQVLRELSSSDHALWVGSNLLYAGTGRPKKGAF